MHQINQVLVRSLLAACGVALVSSPALAQSGGTVGKGVPKFEVRKGYKVTLAASDFGEARALETDGAGTIFVSQQRDGKITSLRDKDGDGVYETKAIFLDGYKQVHAMCFADGWLYATSSEDGSCRRARDTNGDGKADDIEVFLKPGSVPGAWTGHPFRGIVITKEHVYITVSDPQNMSEDFPSPNKCVYEFDRKGENKRQFATGIRNTEKIRLRPGTEEIWGLDHGSDNFGGKYGEQKNGPHPITDLLPGEELNLLTDGAFYGHPFLSNNRIVRPEFAGRKDIIELAAKTTPPAWVFGGHWAGNGFTFLSQDYFPGAKGDIFAAFHGSWNATKKAGYRIERVMFDPETGRPMGSQRIVSCLNGEKALARPVDCLETADGTVLFSADAPDNALYRISKE